MMVEDSLTASERMKDRSRYWEIHDRGEYVCPDCHRGGDEVRRWEVHHINKEPGKIVGLCLTCHKVRHGAKRRSIDLETWKQEFVNGGAID